MNIDCLEGFLEALPYSAYEQGFASYWEICRTAEKCCGCEVDVHDRRVKEVIKNWANAQLEKEYTYPLLIGADPYKDGFKIIYAVEIDSVEKKHKVLRKSAEQMDIYSLFLIASRSDWQQIKKEHGEDVMLDILIGVATQTPIYPNFGKD